MKACLLLSALVLGASGFSVHGAVTYFDANLTNTTLADGTLLSLSTGSLGASDNPELYTVVTADPLDNYHWNIRTGVGYDAGDGRRSFIAGNGSGNTVPVLKTTISGLIVGATYDLYGFSWAGSTAPTYNNTWPISYGISNDSTATVSTMTTYTPPSNANMTLISNVSFYDAGSGPISGGQGLFSTSLGSLTANELGEIYVFVSNNPGASGNRTWYQGLGFQLIPEPSTYALVAGVGLAGLLVIRRRRN